jgi:photosystem II stability/assembly factor-like uncharacterized protein
VALSTLALVLGGTHAAAGGGGGGGAFPQLNGVSFVNSSTGWAVGQGPNGGTVLATTSGGSDWSPQTIPQGGVGDLLGVSFVSTTVGWAVGQGFGGGAILFTDNGGATWSSQGVPGGLNGLNGVSFVNSTTGWAVGQASGGGGAILSTTDGGATWTSQTVPGSVGNLSGVSFVNSTTGVAVGQGFSGGAILTTTDGGATWTSQTVPGSAGNLNAVSLVSTATGWAVGQGGSGAVILRTTDGGTTWTSQTVPAGASSFNGVSFADSSTGWAVGNSSGSSGGVIASTTDGGATWATQTPPSTNEALSAVSAVGDSVWAVGSGTCLNPSILATSNGGSTWVEQVSQLPTQPSSLQSVSFVSSTAGWAVGTDSCGRGAAASTANGGSSWTYQPIPAGIGGLRGVSFVDTTHGWAVGSTASGFGAVILATTNGGATWTSQTVPSGVGNLSAVSFISDTHGWAVGSGNNSGAILTTTDGGTTWTSQSLPTGSSVFNLNGVSFVSGTTTGWAVGQDNSGGAIIRTTDGGTTWTAQTVPGGVGLLSSVSAFSTSDAWAVDGGGGGGGAVILATTDGSTWNAQTVPQGVNFLNGVSAVSASVVWAVGGGGNGASLIATTDGGTTWNSQTVPQGVGNLNGVSAVNTSDAWTVGQGGNGAVILATTDGGTTWTQQPVQLVGPVSASVSTVAASPTSVPAAVTAQSTITVTLRDANGNFVPGKTVALAQNHHAIISGSPATTNGDGQASFTARDATAEGVTFSATDTTDSVPLDQTATVTFTPLVAVSTQQYSLTNSDGATWQDMDASNLTLSVSPSANSVAIITANADLFTAKAGYNQDLGIYVTPSDASRFPGNIVAWKESGGFAGTFSPNAASVETAIPMTVGTTYNVSIRWKTNRNANGATIYAGAGSSAPFSPTRLAVNLIPESSTTLVQSARSTSQYTLTGNDGTTWTDMDATNLALTVTPPSSSTNWVALLSGNADLFTGNTGYNQDIGINVFPSSTSTYPANIVAWKESGGFAGTFSPNAAYVQGTFPMTGGSSYAVKLQWKTNKSATGATIYAGAGPIGGLFSPTHLTVVLVPVGGPSALTSARSTQQYSLTNSDGATWQDMDAANLKLSSPTGDHTVVLGANADLFTANGGYNQDIAIFVSVDSAADQLVAWKESGGFAGTFSPNAAFVQASYGVSSGHTYVFKIKWKTNRAASGATIYAGAGPWPSPGPLYSPTLLSLLSIS